MVTVIFCFLPFILQDSVFSIFSEAFFGCKACDSKHASESNVCMRAKSLQSCLTLRDPADSSLTCFSVHGILQARMEWVAMFASRRSSRLRDRVCGSCMAGRVFTTEPQGKPLNPVAFIIFCFPNYSPSVGECCSWAGA